MGNEVGVLAAGDVPSGTGVFPFHGVLDHGAVQYEEGKDWRHETFMALRNLRTG